MEFLNYVMKFAKKNIAKRWIRNPNDIESIPDAEVISYLLRRLKRKNFKPLKMKLDISWLELGQKKLEKFYILQKFSHKVFFYAELFTGECFSDSDDKDALLKSIIEYKERIADDYRNSLYNIFEDKVALNYKEFLQEEITLKGLSLKSLSPDLSFSFTKFAYSSPFSLFKSSPRKNNDYRSFLHSFLPEFEQEMESCSEYFAGKGEVKVISIDMYLRNVLKRIQQHLNIKVNPKLDILNMDIWDEFLQIFGYDEESFYPIVLLRKQIMEYIILRNSFFSDAGT